MLWSQDFLNAVNNALYLVGSIDDFVTGFAQDALGKITYTLALQFANLVVLGSRVFILIKPFTYLLELLLLLQPLIEVERCGILLDFSSQAAQVVEGSLFAAAASCKQEGQQY